MGRGIREGVDAEEMFMANAFSRYIGHVSAAGKAEYPIPLYTNVWLNSDDPRVLDLQDVPVVVGGGAKAGIYSSGGAVPHTMDLWKLSAPALDFIAPDLYFSEYEEVCGWYRHQDQPLFIPEQRRDERGATHFQVSLTWPSGYSYRELWALSTKRAILLTATFVLKAVGNDGYASHMWHQ
jgi:hypothetical protein